MLGIDSGSDSFVRLNADGTLDTSFANGSVRLAPGIALNDMIIAADEAITYRTTASTESGAQSIEFRRLLANGTPDASFGVNGVVSDQVSESAGRLGTGGTSGDFFIDAAGRIVTAATVGDASGVARLNPDGTRDVTFGVNGFVADAASLGLTALADGRIPSAL